MRTRVRGGRLRMSVARWSNLYVNTSADRVCARLNGGTIHMYEGEPPASVDTPITNQVRLATLTFANPAFTAATEGVATARDIRGDYSAAARGVPRFCRALTKAGVAVWQWSADECEWH